MQNPTILLAAGAPVTRRCLQDHLTADRYAVREAEDRSQAIAILSVTSPHVVVIDLDGETLALLDSIRGGDELHRGVDPNTPIVVLSSEAELQRIRLLERGADDVIEKPFFYTEFRARVAALLRRAEARSRPRVLRAGLVSIDLSSREVHVAGQSVHLSEKEYALLVALAADPTRVLTKSELLREVWHFRSPGRTRTVESHAHRLRRKLAAAGAQGLVCSVRGIGFRLCESAKLAAETDVSR